MPNWLEDSRYELTFPPTPQYMTVQHGHNPWGFAPHPYNQPTPPSWQFSPSGALSRVAPPGAGIAPSQPLPPGSALGATVGGVELKDLLILVGVGLLIWWLVKGGVKTNPGVNKVVRVSGSSRNGFYYRLLRKGAKKHGPFATKADAVDDAESKGYRALGG